MVVEHLVPKTLSEATAMGREPETVFMAGGTDVLAALSDGRRAVKRVVSLRGLAELRERHWEDACGDDAHPEGTGALYLGAGITHEEVSTDAELRRVFPALAQACRTVGAWSTRVAGTLGGNVCTAAPSADSAGPLLAYETQVVLTDGRSVRRLPLADFYIGAGRTVLERGEILLAFRIPHPGAHGAAFVKLSRRQAMEIALVSATAVLRLDEAGRCRDLRVALGTAAPVPLLLAGAAETARGRTLDDGLLGDLALAATGQCRPRSGSFRCEPDYRRRMLGVAVKRAVAEAWRKATEEGGVA
jgi:CO/xanthine dehydrogenase FAD-binding subunit